MNLDSINAFLSEHSVLMSSIAVAVALLTLCFTIIRDIQQRQQWKSLNLARVVIKDLAFVQWRTLAPSEAGSLQFGYKDPFLIPNISELGQIDLNNLGAIVQIAAFDEDGNMLQGVNAITHNQLLESIQRLGRDPSQFEFRKFYRINFRLFNVGTTVAHEVQAQVAGILDDEAHYPATNGAPQRLEPGEETWSATQWDMPLDEPFPKILRLKISLSYKDVQKSDHSITHTYEFDRKVSAFRRS